MMIRVPHRGKKMCEQTIQFSSEQKRAARRAWCLLVVNDSDDFSGFLGDLGFSSTAFTEMAILAIAISATIQRATVHTPSSKVALNGRSDSICFAP
ncbi:MAG TPA: hypothetical protein VGR50_01625 [Terriglobales bacterium]|nr:hypothetical protein [Terriglobales bacterium]